MTRGDIAVEELERKEPGCGMLQLPLPCRQFGIIRGKQCNN
jgi:hypothetical protein